MKRRPPRSTRTDTLFPYTTLFRPFGGNRSDDWRYDQGFAYRIDPATGLVRGIVPLLGGALFSGNTWPQSFTDYRVSPYYERYYGSGLNGEIGRASCRERVCQYV